MLVFALAFFVPLAIGQHRAASKRKKWAAQRDPRSLENMVIK